eukprot:16211107-Heterocapsa_arctica.AAC.1
MLFLDVLLVGIVLVSLRGYLVVFGGRGGCGRGEVRFALCCGGQQRWRPRAPMPMIHQGWGLK